MIKNLRNLSAIIMLAAGVSSCSMKEVITPDGYINGKKITGSTANGSSTGVSGGTDLGTMTGVSATASSASYFPMTKGSTWKYAVEGLIPDTLNLTMTDTTFSVKSRTYVMHREASKTWGSFDKYYIFYSNSVYLLRKTPDANSSFEDMPILKENAAVGASWSISTESGVTGADARFVGTMKEKGISLTVNGKTFTDVYHTQVDKQLGLSGNYSTMQQVTDYYFAKGVGMIKSVYSMMGSVVTTTTIVSYTIK